MNINRNNYEQYFLDHLEGRLSPSEEEILHRFLKFNPDLTKELDSFRLQKLPAEDIRFDGKEKLRKIIPGSEDPFTSDNFEMFCIAYLEGDLTEVQKIEFESYIDLNPRQAAKFELFKRAFLIPGKYKYGGKSALKKSKKGIIYLRYLVPVAAAAAVFLMVVFINPDTEKPTEMAAFIEPEKELNAAKESIKGKLPVQESSTLKVIRNNKAPVPVMDIKKAKQINEKRKQQEIPDELDRRKEESYTLARLGLERPLFQNVNVKYDRIVPEPVNPPSVSISSLSLEEMARQQIQRISRLIENDDELLYSIASNGLKELNRVAGTDAKLMASKDEEGTISGIHFRSRLLNFTAPVNQE
ncbi:MAG: hypothetical protein K9J30_02415 [Bacteroidales bacterium]|nr:hypothetical protein [Bacteroidales bacterium]MCF8352781.1 hypothetical protein [Bacteroidales bacterium]